MRRAFRIAYDGAGYRGFQRQPHGETVSDAVLGALAALGVVDEGTVPPGYAAAGRTDAGVSALAQTVAFDAPEWLDPSALNAELPGDVRAWASADVPPDFHATHDAASRAYVYHLHAPGADPDRARDAADALAGRHDFHNLTTDGEGTVRDLSTGLDADGDFLRLRFRAGGFPRGFVRRAASLVGSVARGAPMERVERVLGADPLPGPEGVAAAAPEPLVLADVSYPGAEFERDGGAAEAARAAFAARRAEHRGRARVAGEVVSGI